MNQETAEIEADQVPLSNLPVMPADDAMALFDDEDVPLAGLPKTGDIVSPAKMMLLLSGMLLGVFGVIFRKKEEM